MYKFKLNQITVNSSDGLQHIIPKKINVIVGPNNSGKSRFLKELRDFLSGDHNDIKIIANVDFPFPQDLPELNDAYNIESKMVQDRSGNWMLKVYSNKPTQALDMTSTLENYFTRNIGSISGDWRTFYNGIISEKNQINFLNWFGSLFFQYLGTEERLTICKTQHDYGLDSANTNYITSIKYNQNLLDKLSNKVRQLFKRDIFLDNQTLGDRLVFRVGENFDYIRNKAIITNDDAQKLFSETMLDDQGDGLKSFVSTFLSLNLGMNDVLLLDEPEAFLHPPLARQLGEMIGESQSDDKTIFIATHSVEVLKGILSSSHDVNVMRITQTKPYVNEIRILDQTILNSILQDPLLRVSRVLEGVFCEKVILTEAEADELIFQELIEKISPESGLYFAHSQNKQTLPKIAELYQKIGISYEMITDFDVLHEPSEFYNFLSVLPMQERERQQLQNYANKLREHVNASVDITKHSGQELKDAQKAKRYTVYHKQGIRFFNPTLQTKLKETLNLLSSLHLHILENGELETLLEDYGVEYQEKKIWIVNAIDKIAQLNKEDISSESNLYRFLNNIVNDV